MSSTSYWTQANAIFRNKRHHFLVLLTVEEASNLPREKGKRRRRYEPVSIPVNNSFFKGKIRQKYQRLYVRE